MIRACIFDLGGTIVDKYSLTPFLSLKSAFEKNDINVPNKLIFKDMGKHKLNHIQEIIRDPHIEDILNRKHIETSSKDFENKIFYDFNNIQKKNCGLMEVLPETYRAINYLKNSNILTGCTTGFNYDNMILVKQKLNNEGILLDNYVSSTCLKLPSRPDPSMIIDNMVKLNIPDPKNIIKIDDTLVGIEEGKNAGCWTVAVAGWSTYMDIKSIDEAKDLSIDEQKGKLKKSKEILSSSHADYVIETLDELPTIINIINNYIENKEKRWI